MIYPQQIIYDPCFLNNYFVLDNCLLFTSIVVENPVFVSSLSVYAARQCSHFTADSSAIEPGEENKNARHRHGGHCLKRGCEGGEEQAAFTCQLQMQTMQAALFQKEWIRANPRC
jgi:hypothetical protein